MTGLPTMLPMAVPMTGDFEMSESLWVSLWAPTYVCLNQYPATMNRIRGMRVTY